ncbi:hypothetical protein [Arcticibacterium luteifluviistationis]|uniref:Uncharacterized protein n=1 Tax=Arcticibacterium luteifluviistationis TaxID=1784714 RepID=A0A2Z4GAU6_9BACT|nr:hypothetical protein [Arcticibacterium luteifluviistationis]AWV98264.1 hypothetical protein DJ013_08815 [Arcticibacterium luteifluviistationis]
MGGKMKMAGFVFLVLFLVYYFEIWIFFKTKIEMEDIEYITTKHYMQGEIEYVYGVKNIWISRPSQYEKLLTEFAKETLDTAMSYKPSITFIALNRKTRKYLLSESFTILNRLELDEDFMDEQILFAYQSPVDSSKVKLSWFNSSLIHKNQTIEESIFEMASPTQ